MLRKDWKGFLVAVIVGLTGYAVSYLSKNPVLDPLFISMLLGIIAGLAIGKKPSFVSGYKDAVNLLIPIGIILYGAVNLNFSKLVAIDANAVFMLFIVFLVYMISILVLSNIFGLREKTGYLIAAGSAICGASAIVITSKSIDAEPDDVSMSLIPVFLSALIGLFIVIPLMASLLKLSELDHGIFSGTVLQFTGFVKAAVANASSEVKTVALSVKAARYVGLLFVIPLLASFAKGRLHVPWFLWAFLGSGLLFSIMPDVAKLLNPIFKPTLTILWSIAMGAIGLNSDLKLLFTKDGLRALGVSFISFILAAGVFLVGMYFM